MAAPEKNSLSEQDPKLVALMAAGLTICDICGAHIEIAQSLDGRCPMCAIGSELQKTPPPTTLNEMKYAAYACLTVAAMAVALYMILTR